MVETAALRKVTEKLDRGATWMTIKGRSGEGKSTIAYMTLKDQHSQGKQVYQVVSPEEFNEVITACADPAIMLDDIFGDLEFDAAEWAKWRPSLQPFVDVNNSDTYTEPKPRDKSAEIPTCLERTKDEQTQVKRAGPNKGKAIIILVGRDYVLKSSLPDLGRMADYISSPQYVVEVTSQRDADERKKIWHVHAKTKHIDFDESTVSRICQADCPHGFPHVCKMFVTAYEHDQTQAQVEAFFNSPLAFLTNTMEKFLQDEIKRSLFMVMIKGDGKISGQELEEDGNLGYNCITAAEKLVGSYLKKEDGTYVFDHPSIYDSVALILSTTQPKFVIENCSLTFIHQRIRLRPSSKSGENIPSETDLVANIPWTCARHLARRFATEIERSNLLHVLSHQACCIAGFVELLMDCVKKQGHMSVPDILKLTDEYSEQSFCELLPSNKSFHLIKFIMEKENISFSQSEIRDILHGVCMNAACSVLTYISQHMELDINGRYGFLGKTPLLLAAQTQDSEFVNQIMSLDPDLYARDDRGQTVFHYLCEYGLTSAVESTINMGVDVKKHYMSPGERSIYSWLKLYSNNIPLYCAIENGHVEVVQLLVRRGCEVDNQEGLRCACKSLNTYVVQLFLDRGAEVDGDAVFNACEAGDLSIISMLFDQGASVNMTSSDGYTPLHSSCGYNPKVVSLLLEKGASVNHCSNVKGDTPLHKAAVWGSTKCVDMLLKAGADVKVQNNIGDTPLHAAAGRGSKECVDMLLKAGADVNVQNNAGDTPLHAAAGRGSPECVDMLLKAGADVEAQNNAGDTPLHKATAAGQGSTECVDMLLKAGADVKVQNNIGDTPLHAAAGRGSKECVDMLLKAGADVNVQNNAGDTPLHAAAGRGSPECVDMLLKAGADVEAQNNAGDTPLHKATAAGRGSTECVDMLLKAGADVKVQNNAGDTPLHKATAAGRGSTECVDMFLKAGADVNVQNNAGDTPLHTAAGRGSTECVDKLPKAGADVKVQNNAGDTPLHKAAGRGSTECVDMLLKAGADVKVQNNAGDTPLHKAAGRGSTECVDMLLKAGADVKVQNNAGDTPLHKAAGRGSTECVDKLPKTGADVHVQNNTGDTPLHAAAGRGYTECVDMLLKAGADVKVQNNTGDTPLHKATAAGRNFAELLKEEGDVNVQNNTGSTQLYKIVAALRDRYTACVDMLLKAGADVNVQNNAGDTPLHSEAQ
ncbi:serine/threonine-protein phosphatase 6 regulatory ankyrin repeat subunit A-like [Haliotis cracherodii]|uniref:serine/threonine-protein phosphatase 6 regulatory ankyrin repeat subunit A-like n=1 Tax=Haliotis cracherodii TaxID=6455 RepID=UPI0039ED39E9